VLKRRLIAAVTVVVAASVLAAGALAGRTGSASGSYLIKATLDTKHQVPTPKDAASARAVLTGKLVLAGKKSSFVWTLSFTNLSGKALAANVGVGAPGKIGALALPLCVKCTAGARGEYKGPYVANPTFVKALLHGGMYAFITTKLNPKGEIRGQIKASSA
jgi:hypothetical protein